MKPRFDVAGNIQKIIQSKGLYQRFVAEKSGFSEQQFCDMLNGRKVIRAEYLPLIADVLNVNISELFADPGQDSA